LSSGRKLLCYPSGAGKKAVRRRIDKMLCDARRAAGMTPAPPAYAWRATADAL
jgi:hypothetical protein